MKNFCLKRVLGALIAGLLVISSTPYVAPDMNVYAAKVLTTGPSHTQDTGWYNDYHHEIWQADTPNSSTMTLNDDDGGFSTTWKCGPNGSCGNFLARRGLFWGLNNPKTWKDYGDFICNYNCTWSAGSSGNSRICIYGWAQNPLVEYYIIEDWKNWSPAQDPNAQYKGSAVIDGSTYKFYTCARNSYTIEGNKAFTQYISIREDKRTSGSINISEHFRAWEKAGMKMGNFYETAFNVEGWESDGQATVKCTIVEGGTPDPGTGSGTTVTDPPAADENGDYFTGTFESGKDNWTGRGGASVSLDSNNYYDGKQSLFVSGRTQEWNGAAIELSTSKFVPGSTYSFSTGVLQKSGSATTMKLTLQYTDSSGKEQYDEVASATAKSGEWTKLENKAYTIPKGASGLILYVEAPDSLTDFYLDNAAGSESGKASSVTTGKGTVGGSSSTVNPGNDDPTPSTSEATLKNVFSKYFKIGTAVSENEVKSHADFIVKHFNSITPENELKPDNILDQSASKSKGNNVNPQVRLPQNLKTILDFAVKYNIPVRGHTFVWHSQTPSWFFKENFDNNGAVVSKEVMDQRIENFIKNTFAMLKENYPTLNLYAYDVVNEAFNVSSGGLRTPGFDQNNGQSPYNYIYGDDSYMQKAFAYAKKYAPNGCKLFYNDFNEYDDGKMDSIYEFCKKVHEAGNLDGIGMQSHLDTTYPDATRYKKALQKFASIDGIEIHVTELDATAKNGTSEEQQAAYYKGIVQDILDCDAVTSLTWWGTNDNMSWRREYKPLMFNSSYQPKKAFDAVISLVSSSEWGKPYSKGNNEQPVTNPPSSDPSNPSSNEDVAVWGDANQDGKADISDAVLIMQNLANPEKYTITQKGRIAGDVYNHGDDLTGLDALTLQQYEAGSITKLPVSYKEGTSSSSGNTTGNTTGNNNTNTNTSSIKSVTSSFENGTDNWESRGSAMVSVDSDSYYSGSKSLKVTGRASEWNGAAINLDSSTYKPGTDISVSAAVMQASGSSTGMKITLQYTDASGKEQYDEVASETVKDKTWTKLENTSYTIPSGASDMILYVEAPDSLTDFYVDDALIAAAGTKSTVTTGGGKVGSSATNTSTTVTPTKTGVDISWIDPSKPMVAISFDDGAVGTASNATSMRIINALAEQNFHATFFYVGNWVNTSNQGEITYAYQHGMEIANHSTTHPKLSEKSAQEIRSEYDTTQAKLKSIIGTDPSPMMRLPYLASNNTVTSTLNDVALITCKIDTGDWQDFATKDSVVNKVVSAMNDGSLRNAIVLCHETKTHTADAIEYLAPYLKKQGWQIVTISEMFAVNGKQLAGGRIYTQA